MSFQSVTLGGNLTRDPEMKYAGEKAVTRFSIAINKRTRDGEKTLFIDCEAWEKEAENVAEYKRKGDYVVVMGEIDIDEWEDKDTGKPRRKYYIKARRVAFEGTRRDERDDRDERPRRRDDRDERPRRRDDRDDDRRREEDAKRYDDLPF